MNEEETHRPFSRRYGYIPNDRDITIREDAPEAFHIALFNLARELGLRPGALRDIVCSVLNKPPRRPVDSATDETLDLVLTCEWFRVYDIAEAICKTLTQRDLEQAHAFEDSINAHFREAGIGWQLVNGIVQTRGPEAFESSVHGAIDVLNTTILPTASDQIHEALRD